jgi:hypothetical protein
VAPGETIDFAPALTSGGPATIELTLGQLTVNKDLTINGPGAHLLTLTSTSRKFSIDDGNDEADKTVAISGLTLTGGSLLNVGAGLRNTENLTLTDSTITGNATLSRRVGFGRYTRTVAYDGGGIWNSGNLTVTDCTISHNRASKDGGGIWSSGNLTLTESVILDSATTSGGRGRYATSGGGGISNEGNLSVTNCTNSGNSTARDGGGIHNTYDLTVLASTISRNSASFGGGIFSSTDLKDYLTTITSSTLSGNTASARGGGLLNAYGLTVIEFSAITANEAPPGEGSGVSADSGNDTRTRVLSTIIAGNINSDVNVDFLFGGPNSFRSDGYNLIGTGNALSRFNQNGDRTGLENPLLGPLANNGGPTRTHAPLAGSPAIDKGRPAADAGSGGVPMFDQRGEPYLRVYNGDGDGGPRIDIGAVELQPLSAPALPGDYDASGTVDAADYLVWRHMLGTNVPPFSHADGNGDGRVDHEDDSVWTANFGNTLPSPSASTNTVAAPELTVAANVPAAWVFATLRQQKSARSGAAATKAALPSTAIDAAITDPLLLMLRHRDRPTGAEDTPRQSDRTTNTSPMWYDAVHVRSDAHLESDRGRRSEGGRRGALAVGLQRIAEAGRSETGQ